MNQSRFHPFFPSIRFHQCFLCIFHVFSHDFPAISSHIPPKGLHLLGTKDADHSLLGKSWGNGDIINNMIWLWCGYDMEMMRICPKMLGTTQCPLVYCHCPHWNANLGFFFAPFLGKPIFISRFSLRGNPSNWSASSYMCWHYGFYRR